MGSLSLYQLIVSAKALLQAGHKKTPLPWVALTSELSQPETMLCLHCNAGSSVACEAGSRDFSPLIAT